MKYRKAELCNCSLSLTETPDVPSYFHLTTSCEIAGLQRVAQLRLVMVPLVSLQEQETTPREEKLHNFTAMGGSIGLVEECTKPTEE